MAPFPPNLSTDSEPRRTKAPGTEPENVGLLVGVLIGAIFIADLSLPATIGVGGMYIVPIFLSLWKRDRLYTQRVALVLSAFALIGLALELRDPDNTGLGWPSIASAAVSLFAIWATVWLGTWRMDLEVELIKSREMVRTTLKSLADGVITTDAEDRVQFMNPIAEKLTGWTRPDAKRRPLEDVFELAEREEEDSIIVSLKELADRGDDVGTPATMRGWLAPKEGDAIPIERSSGPIRDGQGNVRGRVLVFRDVSRRVDYENAIKRLAYRDALTGLANRTSLLDRLQLELAHARRDDGQMAVLFIDLDGFKNVNDTLGHHAGDWLLQEVAGRLRKSLREGDTVARMGGDEFTILLPGVRDESAARIAANKAVAALREPFVIDDQVLPVGCSVGIALYPRDGDDADELLRAADGAMYQAKHGGGGRSASVADGESPHQREGS